jgi:hypothetical protein
MKNENDLFSSHHHTNIRKETASSDMVVPEYSELGTVDRMVCSVAKVDSLQLKSGRLFYSGEQTGCSYSALLLPMY